MTDIVWFATLAVLVAALVTIAVCLYRMADG